MTAEQQVLELFILVPIACTANRV